jgi:uncharacterized protein
MKFLILIGVVLVVVWLMRGLRKPKSPQPPQEPQQSQQEAPKADVHEEMLSCQQCGVHLPRSEALPGRGGVFCSEAHRSAFENQRST